MDPVLTSGNMEMGGDGSGDGSGDVAGSVSFVDGSGFFRIRAIQHYLVQHYLARQGQISGCSRVFPCIPVYTGLPWFPCVPVYSRVFRLRRNTVPLEFPYCFSAGRRNNSIIRPVGPLAILY